MIRYDTVPIHAQKTDEGFIRDKPVIGRTGVLVYRNADGSERREYRPPEEAFDKDSLASLKGKPITIGHQGMVTSQNAANIRPIGTVLSAGQADGDTITADVVLYSLPTSARELSCGYNLDIDETPGTTPAGEPYDAVQRHIRYNHVAGIIPAHAGLTCSVKIDIIPSKMPAIPLPEVIRSLAYLGNVIAICHGVLILATEHIERARCEFPDAALVFDADVSFVIARNLAFDSMPPYGVGECQNARAELLDSHGKILILTSGYGV